MRFRPLWVRVEMVAPIPAQSVNPLLYNSAFKL